MSSVFDSDYLLAWCWRGQKLTNSSDLLFEDGNSVLQKLVSNLQDQVIPELIGYSIFSVIFGLSLTISLLCLFYLTKNWRHTSSHLIVSAFSFSLSSLNIITFILRTTSIITTVKYLTCPMGFPGGTVFDFTNPWSFNLSKVVQSVGFSNTYPVIFFWLSDAFLIYRTWVIWTGYRAYIIFPVLIFLASIVIGTIWMVDTGHALIANDTIVGSTVTSATVTVPDNGILGAVQRWIPALAFSSGLDGLSTAMIASRLTVYHIRRKKLNSVKSSPYFPVIIIFIESAALSTISKILQITIPAAAVSLNLIVIPLCTIATNLIILRKALGADVMGIIQDHQTTELSKPRFGPPDLSDISIPGGFESHLIRTIGGQVVDAFPALDGGDSSNTVDSTRTLPYAN